MIKEIRNYSIKIKNNLISNKLKRFRIKLINLIIIIYKYNNKNLIFKIKKKKTINIIDKAKYFY